MFFPIFVQIIKTSNMSTTKSTLQATSDSKKFDAAKMKNINIMEQISILRPSSWVEWDTWTWADAPDCSEDNRNLMKKVI